MQDLPNHLLPLAVVRDRQSISPVLIRQQPSLLAAIKLCISYAGLEADKEVYLPLGIDAGHWTRITRGEAHFPIDKLCALMDLCGNESPLMWLVDERGYDLDSLRRRESELERDLRVAREQIERMTAERNAERRLVSELLSGRVAA